MNGINLSPRERPSAREFSLPKYVNVGSVRAKQKLMYNFGRKEEVLDQSNQEDSHIHNKRAISEPRAINGNYIGNTDKELYAPHHINEEIEKELVIFK